MNTEIQSVFRKYTALSVFRTIGRLLAGLPLRLIRLEREAMRNFRKRG
jgi:hypothetical protein